MFFVFSGRSTALDDIALRNEFITEAGLNPRSKDKAPALTDCSTPQQIAWISVDAQSKTSPIFKNKNKNSFLFSSSNSRVRF